MDNPKLAPSTLQQLQLFRDRVAEKGKGVRALFTGDDNTGKTLAESWISRNSGLDLYRVDLSQVVSKYIGETEKNLDSVFTTASKSRVVLFFDEADALFGMRTEIDDANDRYANIETSYLLERLEQHDGVVVLSTGSRDQIDEIFLRLMDVVVEIKTQDEPSSFWQRVRYRFAGLLK
jgi:SpoVK/Ycf46/Vps4 family AAA+-type ATPase